MGSYSSVAPCAEVGLLPGETCQFGYINLGAFVENGEINLSRIALTSELLVQALDNCLEISARAYQVPLSRLVLENRRKIGVGICGLADMFIRLGIPYHSAEARILARDIVAFINYQTKIKSHELALERGSFSAMNLVVGCRYNDNPGFLEQKYGGEDTKWVSADNWKALGKKIRETKMLRHCSTVALPPTGRSGLVISASTGIEPLFLLTGIDGELLPCVDDTMRTILNSEERQSIRASGKIEFCGNADRMLSGVFATSTQISPKDQMLMLSSLQGVVDEAISKTINLPSFATIEDVEELYMSAYTENLKGITIYRDGTARSQPKKV
jgi:ribonucleoside-diphosphate reductase alpha chain